MIGPKRCAERLLLPRDHVRHTMEGGGSIAVFTTTRGTERIPLLGGRNFLRTPPEESQERGW